jgi:hypothetical protein
MLYIYVNPLTDDQCCSIKPISRSAKNKRSVKRFRAKKEIFREKAA